LIYLVSSLYLAYLPFNRLKRLLSRFPYLFTILSNTIRVLLSVLVFVVEILIGFKDFITFQGWGATQIKITTSLAKFSTYTNGQYEEDDDKIVLGFFEDDEDFTVAEEVSMILCAFQCLIQFVEKSSFNTCVFSCRYTVGYQREYSFLGVSRRSASIPHSFALSIHNKNSIRRRPGKTLR
jgi:hypothetical protein